MSTVKIVVSGDNHLGKRQYNSPVRERDFQTAWLWVCGKVAEINPDFFILTGDLFDSKRIKDPVTLSVAIEGLSLCGQSKVVAIEGNHDGRSFIHKGRSWLEFLYEQGLVDHILRSNEGFHSSATTHGISFYGAPWSGRGTVDAFDSAVWESVMDHKILDFTVGVFHAAPENYVMGAGTIPAETLLGSKFNLILMGHCHRPFNISDKVVCAGSPEICDIGEIGNGAGIWVVEVDTCTKEKSFEFIEYKPRKFLRIELKMHDLSELPPEAVHKQSVIIVDVVGERRSIDFQATRKWLEDKCDPALVRINDKMTAKAEVRPKSGPEFFSGLVTDLLGDKVTVEEFNSIFDCFESDDTDGVVPVLLEVPGDN